MKASGGAGYAEAEDRVLGMSATALAFDAIRPTEIGDMPETWSVPTLGELFDVQQGKALSQAARSGPSLRPFLRTANVLWGRVDLMTLDRMHFAPEEAHRLSLQPGDLLVCEGGEIGRSALWKSKETGCSFQNHIHRLRPLSPTVDPQFVMYWLWAAFVHLGVYGGVGNRTTIPNLSASRLKQLAIPQPPPAEQRAIAAVLSKLQSSVELQDRVVATFKELKAATMAKLFREGLRGEPLKQTEIGEIPESWGVVRLGEVCTLMNYGTSVRCGTDPVGRPVLRIPNVVNETVDTNELKFAVLGENEARGYALADGDLLFVRTNGNRNFTGRSAVYAGKPEGSLFASYLIRVRLRDNALLPEFAQAFLASVGREQITSRASSAADGKFNIDTGVLRSLMLPRPPLVDQRTLIVAVGALEKRLCQARELAAGRTALFRAILSDLMTGRLRVEASTARSSARA